MSLVLQDRVRETTAVTGTGSATLLGAVTGYQAFSVIGNTNTCYYVIADQSGPNWEVGIGTYSTSGPTLARTTVLASSNAGSLVNFTSGVKDVFVTQPSEKAVFLDDSGYLEGGSSYNITLNGNLTFNGTGKRITGDFSNATLASRLMFQNSITNGGTSVGFIPNGTSTSSTLNVFNNSDPTNASALNVFATSSEVSLRSIITGTGTYLPLTMYTGGAERMRIDTSGNVGIGTASPSYKLHVAGAVAAGAVWTTTQNTDATAGSSAGFITLAVGTNNYGTFSNAVGGQTGILAAGAGGLDLNVFQAVPMTFKTSNTERMRIDSSGNVGIGTNNPTSGGGGTTVQIYGASAASLRLSAAAASTGDLFATGTDFYIQQSNATGSILFRTNTTTTERMRITAGGNVGIGTSVPDSTLSVQGPTTQSSFTGSTYGTALLRGAGGVGYYTNLDFGSNGSYPVARIGMNFTGSGTLLQFGTSNNYASGITNTAMTIDYNGYVGINTTSPTVVLEVGTTLTSNPGIRVGNFTTTASINSVIPTIESGGARIDGNATFQGRFGAGFRRTDGTAIVSGQALGTYAFGGQWGTDTSFQAAKYLYTAGVYARAEGSFTSATAMPTALAFQTGSTGQLLTGVNVGYGTEAMRITSAGDVGIGTTSPTTFPGYKTVQVTGTTTTQGGLVRVTTSDSSSVGQYYSDSVGTTLAAVSAHPLLFLTTNVERMRIGSGGIVYVGTTTGSDNLNVVGSVAARGVNSAAAGTVIAEANTFWSTPTYQGAALQAFGSTAATTIAGISAAGQNALYFQNGASLGFFYSNNACDFVFAPQNTERMRIGNNGNVGIGKSSGIATKLEVNGGVAIQGGASYPTTGKGWELFVESTTASAMQSYNRDTAAWMSSKYWSLEHIILTNGSERMRIDSSGNVGIGTSTPAAKLSVVGTANVGIGGSDAPTVTYGAQFGLTGAASGQVTMGIWNPGIGFAHIGIAATSPNLKLYNCYSTGLLSGGAGIDIDNSGNVLVGAATADLGKFVVDGGGIAVRSGNSIFLRPSGNAWDMRIQAVSTRLDIISGGDPSNPIASFLNGGYVTIGTTSAAGKLTVSGGLSFLDNTAAGTQSVLTLNNSNTAAGVQAVKLNFSSSGVTKCSITGAVYGNGYMAFATNDDTEKMRIDASGNLLVGKTTTVETTTGWNLSATGAGNCKIGSGYFVWNRDTDDIIINFRRSNTSVGNINVTTTATAYVTSSDYRLKEDIAPMTGALDTVAKLKPVTYKWKANGSDGQGFIAHELQSVVPDAVTGEKDAVDEEGNPAYQGIDTSFLVATLTKAIQEQQALIENLTTRLNALEGK